MLNAEQASKKSTISISKQFITNVSIMACGVAFWQFASHYGIHPGIQLSVISLSFVALIKTK